MSKRITTRWYIGAWVVWLIGLMSLAVAMHASGSAPSAGAVIAYGAMSIAGIVMLIMWIGALVKLGMLHAWGWFAGVLILHLILLGIIGMVAYAIWGPEDMHDVAMRPSMT